MVHVCKPSFSRGKGRRIEKLRLDLVKVAETFSQKKKKKIGLRA
jgi:hypothetical protein